MEREVVYLPADALRPPDLAVSALRRCGEVLPADSLGSLDLAV